MKGLWRLLIASAILIVLVAVLFWPKKEKSAASTKPLLTFSGDQVNRIQISQPGQPEIVAVRAQGNWKLQQPYTAAADPATVTSVLGTLADITGAEDLGKTSNLAAYGLDQPSSIQLALANGRTLQFAFGGTAPASGDVYLRLNQTGNVYMAPSYVKDEVIKPAFALQDKSLLHFPEADITGLTVQAGGRKVQVRKETSAWPKAQQNDVQTLLDALQDGVMDSLADPEGRNPAQYGLDHPTASVKLTWKGGQEWLEIGKKKTATGYYARNSQSPAIFVLNNYILDDMNTLIHPPQTSSGKTH